MDKSGGTVGRSFRYDPYHHPPPPHQYVAHPAHHPHHSIHQESTKITPYGEQSKHPPRSTSEKGSSNSREPEGGGKCRRRCCRGIAHGLCSNLGVCALLLSYTLLGSFIFMAIEGGAEEGRGGPGQPEPPTPRRLNGSSPGGPPPASPSSSLGSSPWLLGVSAGPRERTVESIWDITVSLNILYRENWTRLAAEEVAKFQEFLVQRLAEEWGPPPTRGGPLPARPLGSAGMVRDAQQHHGHHEWNFARAFLYSLTVLTTIGYGSVSPRTALGKTVTMAYAALGIPLMLLYLSCIGGLFSRGARAVFGSKHRRRSGSESSGGSSGESSCFHACCCCCAAPRTERKPRSQKQQKSSAANNGAGGGGTASSASVAAASVTTTVSNPPADVTATVRRSRGYLASAGAAAEYREKLRALSPSGGGDEDLKGVGGLEDGGNSTAAATACCSSGTSSAASPSATSSCATSPSASHASLPAPGCFRSFGLAGPLLLCMVAVILYVAAGAAVLARWERWPFLDAAYFCFMSLSTIGFGDLVPGGDNLTPIHGPPGGVRMGTGNATIWFVSLYILTGMALTATCFNILHDEIMQRLKHKYPSSSDAPALHSKSPGSSSGTVGAVVSASGGGVGSSGGGGGGMGGAASTTTTAVSTSSSVRKEGDEDPYS